ncbi:MAG: DUF4339 domain-containing protein, partial [Planctomycetes bacterium]|nr:DUF4339 domain-containing protein [Planctomycetota bacterium]
DPTGRQIGPLAADALEQLLTDGGLTPEWLVWQQGWPDWRPAADVFAGRLAAAPPAMTIQVATPVSAAVAPVGPATLVQSEPAAAPLIVADAGESLTSSARVRVAHRRSRDAPLVALCIILVIALAVLVPLVVWAVAYRQ